ncbi:hypothetical protein CVT25_008672 [Psilocybe cyanescens]|uniref:Uncharacterized protein n=1 Tax=Psilocybe cyanescens TaxID=93625 RepID=A0A409XLA1_PSICY|nr:hypothetical protein CVT25_008672 [Psilocybe cyanescens]
MPCATCTYASVDLNVLFLGAAGSARARAYSTVTRASAGVGVGVGVGIGEACAVGPRASEGTDCAPSRAGCGARPTRGAACTC